MAACRSAIERKMPRRMRCRVIFEKKVSTALSQEAEVGVKWKIQRGCRASQANTLGCLWHSCRDAPHRPERGSTESRNGKTERKNGTGYRFDRRGRPARRFQARASRRARAGTWPRYGERRSRRRRGRGQWRHGDVPCGRPLGTRREVRRLAGAAEATVDRLDILI